MADQDHEAVPLLLEEDPRLFQPAAPLEYQRLHYQNVEDQNSSQPFRDFWIKFYLEQILLLFLPLLATFGLVCWLEKTLNFNDQQLQGMVLYYHEDPNDGTVTRLGGSILNALSILFGIVVATSAFVVCFHFRWYKLIYLWLGFSVCSILGVTTSAIWIEMLDRYRLPLDWFTLSFITWNFTIVGLFAIFGRAPLGLQQAYLIIISAISAISLLRLPSWTTWTVLNVVAVYDIVAVLCPAGPLRLLIDMATERGEEIPALIYTAGMADFDRGDSGNSQTGLMGITTRRESLGWNRWMDRRKKNKNERVAAIGINSTKRNSGYEPLRVSDEDRMVVNAQPEEIETRVEHGPGEVFVQDVNVDGERVDISELEREPQTEVDRRASEWQGVGGSEVLRNEDVEDDDTNPIKLGLGDFIFYSVLIGRAARTNIVTLTICIISVLTGLSMTILLLTFRRQALPALPISIMLGTMAYFVSASMTNSMAVHFGKVGILM